MRKFNATNAVLILFVVAVPSAPAIHGAEHQGKAPITLGPGVTAVNVEEPFEYFTNPWTVIGLRDYPSGTRVSPRGELVLAGGLTVRPLVGESLVPLHRRIARTIREGWLPIVKMDFVLNASLRITIEALAESFQAGGPSVPGASGVSPANYRNALEATLQNVGKEPVRGRIGFEWRPEAALRLRPFTESVLLPGPGREYALVEAAGKVLGSVRIPQGGSAEAEGSRIILEAPLGSGEARTFLLCLPFEPIELAGDGKRESFIVPVWHDADVSREWEGFLGRHVSLAIPEKKVEETFKASLVYQFIGRDGKELHAGEGFYDEVYIRDGAYQAVSVAHAGFLDEAREALEVFLRYQKPDGQMVSQGGQLDANGYAMWAPVELAKLSGDLEFLKRFYGPIKKAAEWAMKARRTEKDPGSPFFGVLPAAIADGEYLWAGKNHILGYDWWNLRGIACVADAARMLGETSDAELFEKEFDAYRKDIRKALDRTGLPFIPPSYEKEGTHWGNLEVVFPTPLLDPHDGRVSATLAQVRNEFGAPEGPKGLIEGTLQWSPGTGAIHPYMSQFVTNTHIIRGEQEEAIDGLYSFLLHTTSTGGFPEGVYFQKREAWGNTVPHLWAAALYVTTLRNMLVREEGSDLHLLSAVPAGWMESGKHISFHNAPTHFGRVDLDVHVEADEPSYPRTRIRVQLSRLEKGRPAPRWMVIHLPPSATIGALRTGPGSGRAGKTRLEEKDGTLVVSDELGCDVSIEFTRAPSARPVDFAAKVASYLASAPDLDRPIPGLVLAPPAVVDEKSCVKLDLASAATTNPLERPFLANGPAFSGIPIGDTKVAGIPFRTVDPEKNGGKGLVILQGAQACAGLPKDAVVAAGGVQGKVLAILGNVTGWGPGDPGTGKWGAVAEYEIRYADGTRQTIPLITGRTCDDWLGDPGASEAAGVLQVAHWHLSVLAITLEPKAIECVVIRDLGTPASPVVAAMTVVR